MVTIPPPMDPRDMMAIHQCERAYKLKEKERQEKGTNISLSPQVTEAREGTVSNPVL